MSSKILYCPAIDTSSASRWLQKILADFNPFIPARALPLSVPYTCILPSANSSAPGLTDDTTIRSPGE